MRMASAYPKDVATPKMSMIHSCQVLGPEIGESRHKNSWVPSDAKQKKVLPFF